MVKNKNKKVKGGAKQVNKRPQPGSSGGVGVSKAGVSPPKQAQDKDKNAGKGKGKGGGKSDRERAEWDRQCAHLKERHVASKHKRLSSSSAAPVLRLGPSVLAATKVGKRTYGPCASMCMHFCVLCPDLILTHTHTMNRTPC